MPRVKSIPVRLDNNRGHDSDRILNRKRQSDDFDIIEKDGNFEEVFRNEYEESDDTPKQKKSKKEDITGFASCLCGAWILGPCSTAIDSSASKNALILGEVELKQTDNLLLLGSHYLPSHIDKELLLDCIVFIHQSKIYIGNKDGTNIVAHLHLDRDVGTAVLVAARKQVIFTHLDFLAAEGDPILSFYLSTSIQEAVSPVLLWLDKHRFSNFSWYGNREILDLNGNMFLSSFSLSFNLEKPLLVSLEKELMSAGIDTPLRQYQLEGVHWIWDRLIGLTTLDSPSIHPGWILVSETPQIYYNEVWQSFSSTPPIVHDSNNTIPSCILADEMGIGKSLQVLSFILLLRSRIDRGLYVDSIGVSESVEEDIATFIAERTATAAVNQRQRRRSAIVAEAGSRIPCICERTEFEKDDIGWIDCSVCCKSRHLRCAGLTHATKSSSDYQCLVCTSTYHFHYPIPAKTSLIIIPGTLMNQWQNEIKKHLNRNTSLRVCIYRGRKRPNDLGKMTPQFLASFDIILISFKALKACFHEADINYETSAATANRRYDIYPPPLLGIEFSVVVIDETQNIEGAGENLILKMSMKLRTRRKFSVSGTPFGMGTVRDLLHLAQFLEISPFHLTHGNALTPWVKFFEQPILPINVKTRVQMLRDLFEARILRRTKAMVRDQLGIAERFILIRRLTMSEFEKKLYTDNVKAINDDLLSKKGVHGKFEELGKEKIELIRKACCHPRIFDPSLHLGRVGGSASIDQVMIIKVEQSKVRCEEAQRDLLFYVFKIAGLRLLQADCATTQPDCWNYQWAAAAIYQFALMNIQRHRQASTSLALFQLVGDASFDNSHLILPCFSSIAFSWTTVVQLSTLSPPFTNNKGIGWRASLASATKSVSVTIDGDNNTSTFDSMATSALCAQWFPSVKLSMVHKKTLLGFDVAPVAFWKLEKFCQEVLNISTLSVASACSPLVILFPAELTLLASEFQDSFVTVMTRSIASPLAFVNHAVERNDVSTAADMLCSMSQVTFQAARSYRARQWKLSVTKCHSLVLLVRKQGNKVVYAWTPFETLPSLFPDGSSDMPLDARLWANIALSETLFDTDALQELHVQHNILKVLNKHSLVDMKRIAESNNYAKELETASDQYITSIQSCNLLLDVPTFPSHLSTLCSSNNNHTNDHAVNHNTIPFESDGTTEHLKTTETEANVGTASANPPIDQTQSHKLSSTKIVAGICQVAEARKQLIEQDYLGSAVDRRNVAYLKLEEATEKVQQLEAQILLRSDTRTWWTGFILESLQYHDGFWLDIEQTIDRSEDAYSKFRSATSNVNTLLYHLSKEFDGLTQARKTANRHLSNLDKTPSAREIIQSSTCQQCRAYFQRYGAICDHCQRFNHYLQPYKQSYLSAARRHTTQSIFRQQAHAQASTHHTLGGVDQYYADIIDSNDAAHDNSNTTALDYHRIATRQFEEGVMEGAYAMFMRMVKKHAVRVLPAAIKMTSSRAITTTVSTDASPSHLNHDEEKAMDTGLNKDVEGKQELVAIESDETAHLDHSVDADTAGANEQQDAQALAPEVIAQQEMRKTILELVKLEVQWIEAVQHEAQMMFALWDRYSELLKTYDEIQQCISRVQLAAEDAHRRTVFLWKTSWTSAEDGYYSDCKVDNGAEAFRAAELPYVLQTTQLEAIQAEAYLRETMATLQFFRRQVEQYSSEMLQLEAFEYHQQRQQQVALERDHENFANSSPSEKMEAERKEEVEEEVALYVSEDLLATDENCGICQETMLLTEARVFLPCAHRFHADCVQDWLNQHRRCPYCRTPVSAKDVRVLQAATVTSNTGANAAATAAAASNDNSMNKITGLSRQVSTLQCFNGSNTLISDIRSISHAATATACSNHEYAKLLKQVKGRWGTKIDALIADILTIVMNPQRKEEKGIIFSQWKEMLDIVADALKVNNIKFTSCFNRAKDFENSTSGIEAFRHNPDLRFLLLPLHLGAEGLDLVVANHVFLLEPLLDHSQESQAINRVDRLGQKQPATFIHKYVLEDTVEERIELFQKRMLAAEQQQEDAWNNEDNSGDEEDGDEDNEDNDNAADRSIYHDTAATATGYASPVNIVHQMFQLDNNNDGTKIDKVTTPKKTRISLDNQHSSASHTTHTLSPKKLQQLHQQQQRHLHNDTSHSALSGGHHVHSLTKSKKKKIGDDDLLDVVDVQFILSLPASTSNDAK